MMNAIRMVWMISRHYNTDERMVPLMELIATEIAGKVRVKSKHRLFACSILLLSQFFFRLRLVEKGYDTVEKGYDTVGRAMIPT